MNVYASPPFITGLMLSAIGIFVFLKNKNSTVNITFALLCTSMVWWLFGYAAMYLSTDPSRALFWARLGFVGVAFIPIFAYHFISSFLDIKFARAIVPLTYLIGFGAVVLSRTRYIYNGVKMHFWGYYPTAGKYYYIFLIMYGIMLSYGVLLLFINLKRVEHISQKRQQLKYLCLAFGIGIFGIIDYFVKYNFVDFYPFGYICALLFISIIAYAIARHQLMDIEVVIKKTLVFASLFTIVFGIVVGITVTLQELIAGGRLLGLAISLIIIIFAVRPLEDFLIRITDKYLFQKKYNYAHLIRQFMDELKTMVLNVQDIAQSTLDFLGSSIRPSSSAIFMQNKFTNKYDIIASVEFRDKNLKISDDTILINELKESGRIINVTRDKNLPKQEREQLDKLGIALVMPLIIHKELLGILFLGKKKSDEAYTDQDVEVLSNLSGALSIAINNAQLFDERADAEKRAMIGTLATGINHEIGNPLNIISIRLQSFNLLAKQGMLNNKTKEEIINEVDDITKTCLESTQRISDITKKISEFAKPDKKLILDKVNVEEAIDETLSILEHELVLERIKFEKNITCDSPYVIADRGQVKQILFNLIKNATQAINSANKENGEITVTVAKHDPKEISIKVADNGPGIPEKDIDKIFMPFYTTKEPGKGTGLGLSLVSRLVERNDARIEVKSEMGKGTAFTLVFKGGCYE